MLGIVLATCVAGLFLSACGEGDEGNAELTLREYPEVFAEDTIIIIGEYARQCELESVAGILAHLEEATGSKPRQS